MILLNLKRVFKVLVELSVRKLWRKLRRKKKKSRNLPKEDANKTAPHDHFSYNTFIIKTG
ncbi:unnamed protein product [marine sediment metagenome]|uniref:Uncharacterized protein n=1 Tax=marine sediment metagenome TaxID=412755 RepID=X1MNG2_9ZZZZ